MTPDPDSRASIDLTELVERVVLSRIRGDEVDVDTELERLPAERRDAARERIARALRLQVSLEAVPAFAGRRIGDFVILRTIGRGGMGIVYLARQISLDRDVALKVLPGPLAMDRDRVRRFLREGAMLGKLRHPGIVRVLTSGEEDGVLYLAMEHVEGSTFDAVLERLALVPLARRTPDVWHDAVAPGEARAPDTEESEIARDIARLVLSVSRSVAHAHDAGVLHRDIKPANIMLTRRGEPRLLDFGLARLTEGTDITRSRDVIGTPLYMAPEVIREGSGASSKRSDVYSIGAVLYEALAGRPPHSGDSITALLRSIDSEILERPRNCDPTIPTDLEAICLSALDVNPERRYADAGRLADDLERFLEHRPVTAEMRGWLHRIRLLARRRRGRLVLAIAAVAVVAIGIVAITFGTRSAGLERRLDAAVEIQALVLKCLRGEPLDEADEVRVRHFVPASVSRVADLSSAAVQEALLEVAQERARRSGGGGDVALLRPRGRILTGRPELVVRLASENRREPDLVAVVESLDHGDVSRRPVLTAKRGLARATLALDATLDPGSYAWWVESTRRDATDAAAWRSERAYFVRAPADLAAANLPPTGSDSLDRIVRAAALLSSDLAVDALAELESSGDDSSGSSIEPLRRSLQARCYALLGDEVSLRDLWKPRSAGDE